MKERSQEKTAYTLITGASEGIGKALAEEFAREGKNLILVALHEEPLGEVARALQENHPGIDVRGHKIDLSTPEGAHNLYHWCRREGLRVNTLVNNAGMGGEEVFMKSEAAHNERMVFLNQFAPMSLMRDFLDDMLQFGEGKVLNVCSAASFFPLPYKSVYSASKSFLYSISRSLKEELRHENITITALCPGPVLTNSLVSNRIRERGEMMKWITLTPDEVAQAAVRGLFRGESVVVPGLGMKMVIAIARMFPPFVRTRFMARVLEKYMHQQQQEKEPTEEEGIPEEA